MAEDTAKPTKAQFETARDKFYKLCGGFYTKDMTSEQQTASAEYQKIRDAYYQIKKPFINVGLDLRSEVTSPEQTIEVVKDSKGVETQPALKEIKVFSKAILRSLVRTVFASGKGVITLEDVKKAEKETLKESADSIIKATTKKIARKLETDAEKAEKDAEKNKKLTLKAKKAAIDDELRSMRKPSKPKTAKVAKVEETKAV